MSYFVNFLDFFHSQILVKPAFMFGIMIIIGNILLSKNITSIISSTIQNVIGFFIIRAGANIIVSNSTNIISQISQVYKIDGSIIDPYITMIDCINALGDKYGLVGYTVLIAFIINIIMVLFRRMTGICTIVLNGDVMFKQAGLMVVFFHFSLQMNDWQTIAYSSCLMTLYWSITSNMLYKPTQEITKNAGFSIGHQQQFSSWLAYKIAPYLGDKSENINDIELPKWLNLFNNYLVATGIVMILFWGVALLSLGTDIIQSMAKTTHWTIYIIETGMIFAAGVAIIMMGVSMFVEELTAAFRGISQFLIPGAVIAIDCAAIYKFSPNAVIWGFIWGATGQILTLIAMILFRFSSLIIPGFIPMFFSNATIGVFANHYGGWRASAKICFFMGVIEILGSVWAIKLVTINSWMGMADWSLVAPFIMQGFKYSNLLIIPILICAVIYMLITSKALKKLKDNKNDY
ncbi:PTS transporter subunit IIC [Candidatus Liberibacter americanus]|uniref:Ascorbate-specific PTS system EIIC component n=1 Tax=Candidatus Liberibacter americanus str. Sao Paulo TaxID=1261131 RepID=U6B5L4_9HYPH|nr:PTS transporter subunit IIC [Candidatus Liberibacter americanus]AHA28088.1 Ascorbate-specific PTS system, EIIC component [Candidatus Liberibacter americanus str. Sao Paulo]EMS36064.1 ascorbate-specific PTS system enzyme IIC/IIB [Candidatus Liberibacter americanus PW_SP]